ncbi:MAG TPA: hypothetical protein VM940_02315, partial [Chthoniobacterales bacterium]|nr:hypothetical protein [Chthoniobacterales bacterium]
MTAQKTAAPPGRLRFVQAWVLLLILLSPSAWMIATIPPLWRDSDAYNQLVQDPLVATFWGHGAAYCHLAKVPLLLGELLENSAPPSTTSTPRTGQPGLTDTGVALLILGQHLALAGAAFYFLTAITSIFWVRLAMALAWGTISLFYTFAHCVGSESLSLILIVLLVGAAIRLVASRDEGSWRDWWVFASALTGCLLSRHINLCLVALLPGALVLSWILKGIQRRFFVRTLSPGSAGTDLRKVFLAVIIVLAAFATAHFTVQGLARKTRYHPHSRLGYTFLWRLRFIDDLAPQSRSALLQRLTTETKSEDARKLLSLLNQMQAEGSTFQDWGSFMRRGIEFFGGSMHWEKLDGALNQMAYTFLIPPGPEIKAVAFRDLRFGLGASSADVTSYLFDTTSYYFSHKADMIGCEKLTPFRDHTSEQISSLPSRYSYFQFGAKWTYDKVFAAWSIA